LIQKKNYESCPVFWHLKQEFAQRWYIEKLSPINLIDLKFKASFELDLWKTDFQTVQGMLIANYLTVSQNWFTTPKNGKNLLP